MYTKIKIDGKEYELKLTARATADLEDELDKNPLTVFMNGVPKFTDLMIMFGYCLPKTEAVDPYELYDKWIEQGHTFNEFVELMVDVMKKSGFIADEGKEKN